MWELREHRVHEDFDALGEEDFRGWRAADAGLQTLTMYRTEFARWEQDADEPDQLGTLAVVWELVEKPCECGSDPADADDECVCDDLAAAVASALKGYDVWPDSLWEASCSPVPWGDDAQMANVWVHAYEKYEYEQDQRFEYSLHPKGVSSVLWAEVFAAVGVTPAATNGR